VNRRAPKLLLDEHIWAGLAPALCEQGYDAVHLNQTRCPGLDDDALLAVATSQFRALLTNDHRDFVPLARAWFEAGRAHAGIVLSVQLPPGELLRQTNNLLRLLSADELAGTVRWLQEFR
jgi:predicted nuclease of predicted toxin-antitoxin system